MSSMGWGNLVSFEWNDLPVGRDIWLQILEKCPIPTPYPAPQTPLYIDRCIKTKTSKLQFDLERKDMFQQVLMNS